MWSSVEDDEGLKPNEHRPVVESFSVGKNGRSNDKQLSARGVGKGNQN